MALLTKTFEHWPLLSMHLLPIDSLKVPIVPLRAPWALLIAASLSIPAAPARAATSPELINPINNPAPERPDRSHDAFGAAMAFIGDGHLVIGAPKEDAGATDAGALHVFNRSGEFLRTIPNPNPAPTAEFGGSVTDLDGEHFAVGAPSADTGAARSGAVYIFHLNGTLVTTITNPTPAFAEGFGVAVASPANDRIVVGAWGDNLGAVSSGAAYVYNSAGSLLTVITNPTPAVGATFGRSIAAVGSGRFVITARNAGAAYLFAADGSLLSTFANPTPEKTSGFAFAVTGVGEDKVLIGAPLDSTTGLFAGAAYLFDMSGSLLTILTNPAPRFSGFGASVAVAFDGRLLIGSIDGSSRNLVSYQTDGTLLDPIASPLDFRSSFGGTTAVSPDGAHLLVACPEADQVMHYQFPVAAAPVLALSNIVAGQITISWTPSNSEFVLQESDSPTTGWSVLPNDGGSRAVVEINGTRRFYRLFKP